MMFRKRVPLYNTSSSHPFPKSTESAVKEVVNLQIQVVIGHIHVVFFVCLFFSLSWLLRQGSVRQGEQQWHRRPQRGIDSLRSHRRRWLRQEEAALKQSCPDLLIRGKRYLILICKIHNCPKTFTIVSHNLEILPASSPPSQTTATWLAVLPAFCNDQEQSAAIIWK